MSKAASCSIPGVYAFLLLALVATMPGCFLLWDTDLERLSCRGTEGSCSIWDNPNTFGGASGDVSGPTDDADMGVEGSVGKGVPGVPGATVEATARYLPRSTEVFDKTHTAAFVEGRYPIVRGEGPFRLLAGVGVGVVRESSSFSSDYGGGFDRIDAPVVGRRGGAVLQEDGGAVTSPMFRVGTGLMWASRTSKWAPFADIGYEIYTASDLNNKAVIRAGVRYKFGSPLPTSRNEDDEGSDGQQR